MIAVRSKLRYPLGKKKILCHFPKYICSPKGHLPHGKFGSCWSGSFPGQRKHVAVQAVTQYLPRASAPAVTHRGPDLTESRAGGGVFHTGQIIPAEKNPCLYRRHRGHFRNFPEKSLQPLWSSPSVPNLWPKPLMLQTKPLLFALSSQDGKSRTKWLHWWILQNT